jgi:hypothetical protein
MTYDCIGCQRTLKVEASVSKPRAVCICEPCVRDSTDAAEIERLLNP